MKGVLYSIAAATLCLAVCISCDKSEEGHSHLSRTEAFGDKYRNLRQRGGSNAREDIPADTVVYVTGVEFDKDYDWRRDSLYGSAGGRIFLMRDGERIVEIEAGGNAHASTGADKHHLVEGHIYTEFCDASMTYIGKDGQELFSFPGREVLRGLIVDGEDVYTLGQGLDGQGLALRRNGKVEFSCKEGCVSGQMLDRSEYPTGALYMDSGHIYFCYWRPETAGSSRKSWFIVEDGHETQVSSAGPYGLYDIRISEGSLNIEELTPSQSVYTRFSDNCLVIAYQDGTLMLKAPDMRNAMITKEHYYYFSFRNSCMCGDTLYVALTPFEKGKAPFVWKNGAVYDMDVNGFLTGISVSVLPRKGS